ncbi:MAG TPA: hypothetical protein VGB37_03650 [Candidatus Lokiarchaeia archaeon]
MELQSAKQRTIKDVKNDDFRIQIIGYVKKVLDNNYFLLTDKTGEIKVNLKDLDFKFKENDLINVIGDLNINTKGEMEFTADIVQDMNNLNFKYYIKLYDLKKEIG